MLARPYGVRRSNLKKKVIMERGRKKEQEAIEYEQAKQASCIYKDEREVSCAARKHDTIYGWKRDPPNTLVKVS